MNNEEAQIKKNSQFENNIIDIKTHALSKQIIHLLKTLNPQIKSSNLNEHFNQLIQSLITQSEFIEFDLQIKMKSICLELEKCISNSIVTLVFFDPITNTVKYYAAPSMRDPFGDFSQEFNRSDNKIDAPFEYKIRVSDISKDRLWEPYYHHFENMGLTSSWTIPIYRTSQLICFFAIFSQIHKGPIDKELNCIQEQNNHFNKLICEYPTDLNILLDERYS